MTGMGGGRPEQVVAQPRTERAVVDSAGDVQEQVGPSSGPLSGVVQIEVTRAAGLTQPGRLLNSLDGSCQEEIHDLRP
jgi:hypothetical protein